MRLREETSSKRGFTLWDDAADQEDHDETLPLDLLLEVLNIR